MAGESHGSNVVLKLQCGQPSVTESQLERVIEGLEHRCWDKIQTIVKNEEGLGIEYDENVICDVCRSVSTTASIAEPKHT